MTRDIDDDAGEQSALDGLEDFGRTAPVDAPAPAGTKLHIVPVDLATAKAWVNARHRHLGAPVGHKFSVGVADEAQTLHGVATIGRPVARHSDDGLTLEITRCCTDGTPNACSALYGAAARAAFAMGYARVITFTRADEPGTSLKASNFKKAAESRETSGWDKPSRRRPKSPDRAVAKTRWQIDNPAARPVAQPAGSG